MSNEINSAGGNIGCLILCSNFKKCKMKNHCMRVISQKSTSRSNTRTYAPFYKENSNCIAFKGRGGRKFMNGFIVRLAEDNYMEDFWVELNVEEEILEAGIIETKNIDQALMYENEGDFDDFLKRFPDHDLEVIKVSRSTIIR